jgi:uncharacterized coiled-coil protein SlyX
MMDVVAEANASELPRILHKSSRRSSWILVLLVFFGLCAAAACVWTNMETILARSQVLGPAPMHGLSPEVREALLEVRSEQQRASDVIAELNRNIGAQQADLKRMTDQIEALTAKIESLRLRRQSLLRLQPNQLRSWRKERSSPLSQKGQFPLAARR